MSTCAIDTTAVPAVIKQAAQALGIRGELVVLGLGAEEFPIDAIDIMQNGKVIRGSIEGDSDPQEMVPRLLGLHAAGQFDVDDAGHDLPVHRDQPGDRRRARREGRQAGPGVVSRADRVEPGPASHPSAGH